MSLRSVFQLKVINKRKEQGDVQGLIKIVKESAERDDLVFHKALSALCEICDESAETTLIETLAFVSNQHEEHWILRKNIYECLGQSASPNAVEVLIIGLRDEFYEVRETALKSLALTRNPHAVQPIIDVLTKVRLETKKDVLESLKYFDKDALFEPCRGAINCNGLRSDMVELMGYIGDDRALDVLIACLSDKTYYARRDVAIVLRKFKEKRTVEALITVMTDDDFFLRLYCVSSLGKIADPMAKEALWGATKDTDSYVREAAYMGLVAIESAEASDSGD